MVRLSVFLATMDIPAKMAELTEVLFAVQTQMGPRNHAAVNHQVKWATLG